MKNHLLCSSLVVPFLIASTAFAQAPAGGATSFGITKINKDLITMPQYGYVGGLQITANQRDLFLQVETEFSASGEPADDVTFKYFISLNGKVLTGEVVHTNVLPGKGLRSVIFAPPRVLERFNGGRPITAAAIQNIAVQIVQGGAIKDEASFTRAAAKWYSAGPQVPGLLLNKNETPFAPLYWDRYEQIKTSGH